MSRQAVAVRIILRLIQTVRKQAALMLAQANTTRLSEILLQLRQLRMVVVVVVAVDLLPTQAQQDLTV